MSCSLGCTLNALVKTAFLKMFFSILFKRFLQLHFSPLGPGMLSCPFISYTFVLISCIKFNAIPSMTSNVLKDLILKIYLRTLSLFQGISPVPWTRLGISFHLLLCSDPCLPNSLLINFQRQLCHFSSMLHPFYIICHSSNSLLHFRTAIRVKTNLIFLSVT